jgi:hypothetical protein
MLLMRATAMQTRWRVARSSAKEDGAVPSEAGNAGKEGLEEDDIRLRLDLDGGKGRVFWLLVQ